MPQQNISDAEIRNNTALDTKTNKSIFNLCDLCYYQGWLWACTQPTRDVVTKLRRLSLAGHKPKISPY